MEAFSGLQKKVGFGGSLISTPPVLARSGLWSSVSSLPERASPSRKVLKGYFWLLNEEAFSLVMEAFSGLKQKKVGFGGSLISTPLVLVRSGLWSSVSGLLADKISEIDQPAGLGKIRPMVRTSVPVDGRFEHLVLSCNLTSDHAIIWMERESQRALDLMMETEQIMEIPAQQRMQRQVSLAREHNEEYKAALRRAVALDVPEAYSPSAYGTFDEINEEGYSSSSLRRVLPFVSSKRKKESWDDLAGHLFDIFESGQMVLK
ncbi:hypothetical protein RHGRI_008120 [Rhododendron griersonianum]|uniref:Uncharacterized protein n=1 Tax=Rhododendron griersonianum TaxID=479676 RepID=A0AAV6L1E2_9ERIC|nr:hypothetical protein RHGRI_008120 [Rhododendron griersonianum]